MPAANTIQQNLLPNEPHLVDLLNSFKKDILLDLNSHHVGTIQSFDPSTQTASVTINYVKTFFQFNADDSVYEAVNVNYPVIAQAPVICLGGGGSSLTFPIQAGDECLVLFNDRDLDNWFSGGTGSPNATARLHSFADAIILVGLRSLANVLSNYDTTRAVLQNGDTMVGVSSSKVKIANSSTSLLAIINGLISAINGMMIVAPSGGGPCTITPISPSPSPGSLLE